MTVTRRQASVVSNVSGTSAATIVVPKHTDLIDGDLLVAISNGPVGTQTAPAGWILLAAAVSGTTQSNMWKKIAASEGASWTFNFPATSSINVAVISFAGAHDVLSFDHREWAATSSIFGRQLDAPRDSVAYFVGAWRDGTTNTSTSSQGAEDFDAASANTGSTIFRGITGSFYGPGVNGVNDIVNTGDAMPGNNFNFTNPVDLAVAWQFLVDNREADTEDWVATNGQFNIDVKLDDVQIDSVGRITSEFRGDITNKVVAFAESGENAPNEITENLADGVYFSKWLTFADSGYVQYDMGTPMLVKRYRLKSATDAAERDPSTWTLKGSNDGVGFTNLDTRTGIAFATRQETQEFKVTQNRAAYRYYRLDIASNFLPTTANSTQLAEFRLSTHDVWEDITSYATHEAAIRITRGLQGSSGRSDFTRAYYELDNTDGRFSIRNQDGPYYGSLQRNTQNRISKAFGTKSLHLQGDVNIEGTNMTGDAMRTTLTDTLSLVGDLDLRMDIEPRSWRDAQTLSGVAVASSDTLSAAVTPWAVYLDGDGKLNMARYNGSSTVTAQSTIAVPQATRKTIRVTFDVDNGAAGNTTTFYTADNIAGPWTQLGDPVIATGTAATVYTGGALCIGHVGGRSTRGMNGLYYNYELRSSIGGTLVSDIDFTTQTNGSYVVSENSNRWVAINNAVISNRRYRFHGEVAEWPLSWDPTGTWITASVTGAGVQKRMEQVTSSLSAMRRLHTKGIILDPGPFERFAQPAAYWPLEDGNVAGQMASGLPSKPGMQIYGKLDPQATQDGFNESLPLPQMGTAKFGGRVTGAPNASIDLRWILYAPDNMVNSTDVLEIYSTGSVRRWRVTYELSNTWRVRGYDEDDSGAVFRDTGNQTITTNNEKMHMRLFCYPNGSETRVTMEAYDVFGTLLGSFDAPFLGSTIGKVFRVNVNQERLMATAAIGHIALYGQEKVRWPSALNGDHYETAGRRMKRLADEENIEFRFIGDLDQTAFMGYQETNTPFQDMSSAAVSDGGFLVDPLEAFGLEYRTVRSLLNQPAHITLSYSSGALSGELQPVADDAYVVNDFTASRGGAGSARAQQTEGPLSVNPPPVGVGAYEGSQSYSLAHEGQCVDIAGWEVHKGTLDEERYTSVTLALENLRIAADTSLAEKVLQLDVGDRVDITDTPSFLTHDDIRQIVIGYSEQFDQFQHQVTLNTLPARSFEVAEYDGGYHFDTNGTTLYQDISPTQTNFEVEVTNPANAAALPFTEEPLAFPYDIRVDGETMRVRSVGRHVTTNSGFDANIIGWSGAGCTVAWDSYTYPHDQLAFGSMKITPDGVTAAPSAIHDLSGVGTVTPQLMYKVSGWFYSATAYADIRPRANWYDAAGVSISASSAAHALAAGKWTFFEDIVAAPALASQVKVDARLSGTPAASAVVWVWNLKVTEYPAYNSSDQGDSFNRADSATVLGSTDRGDVEAWVQNSGTWGINGNTAYISAAATSIATIAGNGDFEDCEVTVSTWPAGTHASLVFRYTDANNYMWWGGTVAGDPSLNIVVAGVTTTWVPDAGGTDFTLAQGDTLSARTQGSVVSVYRNGKQALTISTTANQTAVRVGMRLTAITPRMNNFYFKDNTGPQRLQVERGVNGAASRHVGGTEVALQQTPTRGI